jgi:hypothetical protein
MERPNKCSIAHDWYGDKARRIFGSADGKIYTEFYAGHGQWGLYRRAGWNNPIEEYYYEMQAYDGEKAYRKEIEEFLAGYTRC